MAVFQLDLYSYHRYCHTMVINIGVILNSINTADYNWKSFQTYVDLSKDMAKRSHWPKLWPLWVNNEFTKGSTSYVNSKLNFMFFESWEPIQCIDPNFFIYPPPQKKYCLTTHHLRQLFEPLGFLFIVCCMCVANNIWIENSLQSHLEDIQ